MIRNRKYIGNDTNYKLLFLGRPPNTMADIWVFDEFVHLTVVRTGGCFLNCSHEGGVINMLAHDAGIGHTHRPDAYFNI